MTHWPEVEWEDGYPLAEDNGFAEWRSLPLDFREAAHFLLRELPKAAENCCASCEVTDGYDALFKDKPVKRIRFSTGGWSGAESLIGLIEGRFDTSHFMESWRRGGHYVFEIPEAFYAPRDSGSRPEGEDSRSEAEGEARQNGDAESGASPNPSHPSQFSTPEGEKR